MGRTDSSLKPGAVSVDQHLPGAGLQPDLLPQLPGGREMRWLPSDVEQPRGQFPKPPTMAVLINHRDVAVVVHRHNGYGTEVLDDLASQYLTRHPPGPGVMRKWLPYARFPTISSQEIMLSHETQVPVAAGRSVGATVRCVLGDLGDLDRQQLTAL